MIPPKGLTLTLRCHFVIDSVSENTIAERVLERQPNKIMKKESEPQCQYLALAVGEKMKVEKSKYLYLHKLACILIILKVYSGG